MVFTHSTGDGVSFYVEEKTGEGNTDDGNKHVKDARMLGCQDARM